MKILCLSLSLSILLIIIISLSALAVVGVEVQPMFEDLNSLEKNLINKLKIEIENNQNLYYSNENEQKVLLLVCSVEAGDNAVLYGITYTLFNPGSKFLVHIYSATYFDLAENINKNIPKIVADIYPCYRTWLEILRKEIENE